MTAIPNVSQYSEEPPDPTLNGSQPARAESATKSNHSKSDDNKTKSSRSDRSASTHPGGAGSSGVGVSKRADPKPDEPRTELGYARRLVAVFGDRLRYVPAWKKWLVWDGTRWAIDSSGQYHRWQKTIARRLTIDAMAIADNETRAEAVRMAKRGESSAGVSGALALAATEAGIAVSPDQLDADPFLLSCTNGVLDLRTGKLGPHDPALLLTKITRAAFEPSARGVEFYKFLKQIQPETSMQDYLPRLLGHAIEGRVVEHVLPIFYGCGANGKSTLIDAVLYALGD
jgi:putative DNA primase/helicase